MLLALVTQAHALENANTNPESGLAAFVDNLKHKNQEDADILPPDQAFKLSVDATENNQIIAHFEVAPGHYLYHDRIKFSLEGLPNAVQAIELPQGEIKKDPTFGETTVYHHSFSAKILLASNISKGRVKLLATYQGCSEKGLCYAPIHKTIAVDLPSASSVANNDNANNDVASTSGDQATSLLKNGHLWLITIGFFGFGLLLALTPCVLPMIPILSGIIVGDKKVHHHATSRLHAFNLSLAYTLGMALTYTIAGIAAGLSGKLLSSALQNPVTLGITAIIFVALSLSMFGFYELRLPSAIESKMVNASNKLKGGQFLGVFVMGALSALIVSPCVAAPLAGALVYISQTHDVLLGGLALFSLSIGMGVPLLLIGASAGHILPKAGHWMTAVRNLFGIIMLAVALFIVSPVIPSKLQLLLWAALFIIPAVYLHALDSLPNPSDPWANFWKGIGILMLLLGITLFVGAVTGAKSPLQPLAGLQLSSNTSNLEKLPFQRVKSVAELDDAIQAAKGKVVMLDFYADWCTACKEMERDTFTDKSLQQALKAVVLLQADVTDNTSEDTALLNRFKLFGPPGIIFFNADGQEIAKNKVVGYQDAPTFIATVKRVNALKDNTCNQLVAC
ncbi:MAG TPA: protein-disulfide reductase DsbD [Methylophilaceae bacterium]|jgi:thiol:disulfide interchange protein DsbD